MNAGSTEVNLRCVVKPTRPSRGRTRPAGDLAPSGIADSLQRWLRSQRSLRPLAFGLARMWAELIPLYLNIWRDGATAHPGYLARWLADHLPPGGAGLVVVTGRTVMCRVRPTCFQRRSLRGVTLAAASAVA
jgi:hypothetical protein